MAAVQPSLAPDFPLGLGIAQMTGPEPHTTPVEGATPEMPVLSATVSAQAQGPWPGESAMPQPQPEQAPIPDRVLKPTTLPVHSTLEGAPASGLVLRPGAERSDTGLVSAPKARHPRLTQVEVEPGTPPMRTRVMPQIQEVSEPEAVAKVQPAAPVPGGIPVSGHASDSSPRPLAQPPPAGPAAQLRTPHGAFVRSETGPVVTPAAISTTPVPPAREAPEPESVLKVGPAMPHVTTKSQPVIRPAPVQSPTFPAPEKPAVTPSEPRSIQVRIGRIEVRAITPPAPPAPRTMPARPGPALSLDDYLKQRNEGKR